MSADEKRPAFKQYEPRPPHLYRDQPCCDKAKIVPCYCIRSWDCSVHGRWCYGKHD